MLSLTKGLQKKDERAAANLRSALRGTDTTHGTSFGEYFWSHLHCQGWGSAQIRFLFPFGKFCQYGIRDCWTNRTSYSNPDKNDCLKKDQMDIVEKSELGFNFLGPPHTAPQSRTAL
ncbi:hypothetical protein ABW19_dt0201824 [Dactylella cylindrospora]|nr:hypothetical protein ABW19_dt0201824 [Dactylella cylindrospora]